MAGCPFFIFHERARERTGCGSYSWTHPCVLASIPIAEGLSTALLNAVLLYRLVTWHQELTHDSSAGTVPSGIHTKAHIRPRGPVLATIGP